MPIWPGVAHGSLNAWTSREFVLEVSTSWCPCLLAQKCYPTLQCVMRVPQVEQLLFRWGKWFRWGKCCATVVKKPAIIRLSVCSQPLFNMTGDGDLKHALTALWSICSFTTTIVEIWTDQATGKLMCTQQCIDKLCWPLVKYNHLFSGESDISDSQLFWLLGSCSHVRVIGQRLHYKCKCTDIVLSNKSLVD